MNNSSKTSVTTRNTLLTWTLVLFCLTGLLMGGCDSTDPNPDPEEEEQRPPTPELTPVPDEIHASTVAFVKIVPMESERMNVHQPRAVEWSRWFSQEPGQVVLNPIATAHSQ